MFILPSGKCVNDILRSTFHIHFNKLSLTICALSYVSTGKILEIFEKDESRKKKKTNSCPSLFVLKILWRFQT